MNQRLISWLTIGVFFMSVSGRSAFAQNNKEAVGDLKKNADAAQQAFAGMQKNADLQNGYFG